MPHEYLSDEQIARYGRSPDELSTGGLEQFFRTPSGETPSRWGGEAAAEPLP